jgi:hypothetical protein
MFATSSYDSPRLATRFGRDTFVVRGDTPLVEEQMRRAAPSIFAEGKHVSRSARYTYIPTIARRGSSPSWWRRARAASRARPSSRST